MGDSTKRVNEIPVVQTMPADLLTPLAVYLKLSAGTANSFLLESVEGGRSLARYSFIGVNPEMIVRGSDERVEISDLNGTSVRPVGLIDFLKSHFANRTAANDRELPAFLGGAIGYLGF